MNRNKPLFNKIQKVARHFGVKPMFVDYDLKKDKAFFTPLKKGHCPRKLEAALKHLVYVCGVPLMSAIKLYLNGVHRVKDNVFYKKIDEVAVYTLIDCFGKIKVIGYVTPYCDKELSVRVVKATEVQQTTTTIIDSYSHKEILSYIDKYMDEHAEMFKVL